MDYTEYLKAKKLGDKFYRNAIGKGEYPYLPALDEILSENETFSQKSLGYIEIPLSMIRGTKTIGRQNSFAGNFMPILNEGTEFSIKWTKLIEAQMDEGITDPIKVYEYLKQFYVLEGNKRVSVMKYLDMLSYEAEVIRILPEKSDDFEIKLYYEFLDFYKQCPIYEITFSHLGDYQQFLSIVQKDENQKLSLDEIHTIQASYYRFLTIFESKNGKKLNMTPADAMLVYLNVYSISSLLDQSRKTLEERFERIRDELLLVSNGKHTSFVKDPVIGNNNNSIFDLLRFPTTYSEMRPLKAYFIYDSDIEHHAIVNDQEIGRIQVEHMHEGVLETHSIFNVQSDDALKEKIDDAIQNQANIIFTNSPLHMNETLRGAIEYPNVHFLNYSTNFNHQSVRTYAGRMYEVKFLMGVIAAAMSQNHKIGYIANIPIYGQISDINAFAIGASLVDTKAEIYLQWDCVENANCEEYFSQHDIHMIAGRDWTNPQEDTIAYGLYEEKNGEINNLSRPVWNWGKYYDLIIRSVLDHTYEDDPNARLHHAVNYWYGMSSGVVDLVMSQRIPYQTRKLVEMLKKGIITNTFSPFENQIKQQDGKIQEENIMKNETIIKMDWLNENIIGDIPSFQELNEMAKEIVKKAGVEKVFHQESVE